MKSKEQIETPEVYFERHPLVLIIWISITTLLVGTCFYLFAYKDFYFHGYALAIAPFALFSVFQTLLFILNPYALLFKDRMMIKKNMFSNKEWYFIDIKKVSDTKNNSFVITYNDDDVEKFILKGIKPSHINKLRNAIEKKINESLAARKLQAN